MAVAAARSVPVVFRGGVLGGRPEVGSGVPPPVRRGESLRSLAPLRAALVGALRSRRAGRGRAGRDQPAVRTGGIAKVTVPWVTITKPHVEQRRKAIPLLKPSGSAVTCSHLVLVLLSVMRLSRFMDVG